MTTSPRKNSVGLPRLTIEEMHAIAAKQAGKYLSAQYVNAKTHLEWECAEGHRWLASPRNIKNGRGAGTAGSNGAGWICPLSGQTRRGRCLSDEYVNSRSALLIKKCSEMDGSEPGLRKLIPLGDAISRDLYEAKKYREHK